MPENPNDISILIVDDEESIRITFSMFLKREGYGHIATAASLEQALALINETRFDLIISDIVLQDASGIDLLRYIRKTGLQCPVVMITGFPNIDSAAKAVRHGAFDYIAKPVNKENLLRFVKQALTHWRLQQEKEELRRENEKYRRYLEAIFSSVHDAIITVNDRMEIIRLNDTAKKWLAETVGKDIGSLEDLSGDMGLACLQDAQKVIDTGQVVQEHQVECVNKDGSTRMVSLNAAPLRDGEEEFFGAVIVARDINMGRDRDDKSELTRFHGFIGSSPPMQAIYRLIENVGRVDAAVLVTGESGTGKELTAEALHAESVRQDRALVKVDCAAISEDLLESELFGHVKGAFTGAEKNREGRLLQADGGTLFLDEIGDISARMQLRLLRFLQEKTFSPVGRDDFIKVDVRVIAATNVDLIRKVNGGQFREDLYYRLKVVEIALPPLRSRKQCIPLLVDHFVQMFRGKMKKRVNKVSDQAMELMVAYSWPGNVRELRHVIERACVLCEGTTILREHLAQELVRSSQEKDGKMMPDSDKGGERGHQNSLPEYHINETIIEKPLKSEKARLIEAIDAVGGNKSKAAKLLGINRSTLYRKMKKYGLES